jgi:hypothetical protein
MTARLFLPLLLLVGAPALALDPVATEPTVEELLRGTDDITRGTSSIAIIEMHVQTSRYTRTMRMKAFTEGTEKSLIRIEAPAKDAGIATLKVDDNLWNYLPKVDRTMKVPAGMMGGSWMGSHFTNDDLVGESRLSEDFTWTVDKRPQAGVGNYVITLVPRPDAAVVWGKVVAEIRPDKIPVEIGYYDEKGARVRTMTWTDIKDMDGRTMPTVMTIVPADKPDEYTKISYVSIDFDADLPSDTFTQQALRK